MDREQQAAMRRWDLRVGALMVLAIIIWVIIWIVTGVWWTILMMIPTELLVIIVITPLANRSEGFNIITGRRA